MSILKKGRKEMYCEKCNWEGEGNFCPWCGNKAVSKKHQKVMNRITAPFKRRI